MEVRTRFAPSPTGYMHIGNLRTALYEYLIAKSQGGKFILRIEDTDQGRLVEGSLDVIYKTMKMTGLQYDEGPDIGGEYGPYVQSERMGLSVQALPEYEGRNITIINRKGTGGKGRSVLLLLHQGKTGKLEGSQCRGRFLRKI